MPKPAHVPVLAESVVRWLVTDPRGLYWDATVGAAGHARMIVDRLTEGGKLIGSDRDPQALSIAAAALTGAPVTLILARFSELAGVWRERNMTRLNGILFDFGIGSFQIDRAERGLGFDQDGPLDMRMDPAGEPLAGWLNRAPEDEIKAVLRTYGEERRARTIARAIVARRPLARTSDLRAAVAAVSPPAGRAKILARVFQAFRIHVNDELTEIDRALAATRDMVAVGGRVVAISYHSLEDRRVKGFFRDESTDCLCPPGLPACVCGHRAWLRVLTRRPERPGPSEVSINRRARSARMRVAERIR